MSSKLAPVIACNFSQMNSHSIFKWHECIEIYFMYDSSMIAGNSVQVIQYAHGCELYQLAILCVHIVSQLLGC